MIRRNGWCFLTNIELYPPRRYMSKHILYMICLIRQSSPSQTLPIKVSGIRNSEPCLWRPDPGPAFVAAIECTSCWFNQIVAMELYSLWSINAWFITVPNPFTPINVHEWPSMKVQRTNTGILLTEYNALNGRRIDVRDPQIIVMDDTDIYFTVSCVADLLSASSWSLRKTNFLHASTLCGWNMLRKGHKAHGHEFQHFITSTEHIQFCDNDKFVKCWLLLLNFISGFTWKYLIYTNYLTKTFSFIKKWCLIIRMILNTGQFDLVFFYRISCPKCNHIIIYYRTFLNVNLHILHFN